MMQFHVMLNCIKLINGEDIFKSSVILGDGVCKKLPDRKGIMKH